MATRTSCSEWKPWPNLWHYKGAMRKTTTMAVSAEDLDTVDLHGVVVEIWLEVMAEVTFRQILTSFPKKERI